MRARAPCGVRILRSGRQAVQVQLNTRLLCWLASPDPNQTMTESLRQQLSNQACYGLRSDGKSALSRIGSGYALLGVQDGGKT